MSAIGAAVGVVADRWVGEPPTAVHPVAWFGTTMTKLEERLWRDSRGRGVVHAAAGIALAGGTGAVLDRALPSGAATATAATMAVAGRMLGDVALEIGESLAAGDLEAARHELRSLVGRRRDGLDEADIARAVVESVAENTVDAVVAPALWAGAFGAAGALAYRAVNTLDAMVGHHSPRYERFGWASARADDVANFLPARLGAVAVMAARPARAGEVLRIVRRDAAAHPSPNSGVIEAAFAAALGVQLGGRNHYGDRWEDRARLGDGPPPTPADISRAVRLSRDVSMMVAGTLALVGIGQSRRRR
jgi:adenosylcobinamide-phosphate synthase